MELLSVNIGAARAMSEAKVNGKTGIYKEPCESPVYVGALGLTGDAVCDTKNHGGPDQAVYLYGTPDYAWWAAELGAELEPGTFGENLTIAGLESAAAWVGDRLRIGDVLLEVTAPRIPCLAKLMLCLPLPVVFTRHRTPHGGGVGRRHGQARGGNGRCDDG